MGWIFVLATFLQHAHTCIDTSCMNDRQLCVGGLWLHHEFFFFWDMKGAVFLKIANGERKKCRQQSCGGGYLEATLFCFLFFVFCFDTEGCFF